VRQLVRILKARLTPHSVNENIIHMFFQKFEQVKYNKQYETMYAPKLFERNDDEDIPLMNDIIS